MRIPTMMHSPPSSVRLGVVTGLGERDLRSKEIGPAHFLGVVGGLGEGDLRSKEIGDEAPTSSALLLFLPPAPFTMCDLKVDQPPLFLDAMA